MKTRLDLNDPLLANANANANANAKALAAQQRTSSTRLIDEGLLLRLGAMAAESGRSRKQLPVFKGLGGLVAGVEPQSNKALLQALGQDA